MTTIQLDREFLILYPNFETYASKAIRSLHSQADLSAVLAECYLHLRKCEPQIKSISDLEAFGKNWIKQNLKWHSSPLNKQYRSLKFEEISENLPDTNFHLEIFLEEKTREFHSSLTAYEQRLWSIYFEKHKISGRLISEHLDMSLSTGYTVLRECKDLSNRYREFLLRYI